MPTLEEIRQRFRNDRFATQAAGVIIESASPERVICAMELREHHRNAYGAPMGGAVFTLADFAFAVAANAFSECITVSRHVSVTFLSASRGSRLVAETRVLSSGRHTCLYQVDVHDDTGRFVACATVDGYVVEKNPTVSQTAGAR